MQAAFAAGADAVYAGTDRFSARSFAKNFSMDEMTEAVDYAHLAGRKLYLTVNILMKEHEIMDELYDLIAPLYERGLDAVIVQDFGVVRFLHQYFPSLPIHASTQMSITSAAAARVLSRYGVTRIVPARELSLSEIRKIREQTGLEIESFVHGAMCYAYSGKCLFSSSMGDRSGNRGSCAQPCRLLYRTDKGDPSYLLSMHDMNVLPKISQLIDAGISSFKIEGRMKDAEYVSSVTGLYRKYVDLYQQNKLNSGGFHVSENDIDKAKQYARNITGPGYYFKRNGPDMITPDDPSFRMRDESSESVYYDPCVRTVHIDAQFIPGQPAELKLSSGEVEATVCSANAVEPAKSAPLNTAKISDRLNKADRYPFDIQIDRIGLSDPVFMPVSQINEIRRQGLSAIADELLKPFARHDALKPSESRSEASCIGKTNANDHSDREIHVLVSTDEQWKSALGHPLIDRIYVESNLINSAQCAEKLIKEAHKSGNKKKIMIALPHVFREFDNAFRPWIFSDEGLKELSLFDGVLVRCLDTAAWLKERGYRGVMYADHLFYTFNSQSMCFADEIGVCPACYPVEMSRHDIRKAEEAIAGQMLTRSRREILVYGYTARMISAQCVRRNTSSCQHRPGIMKLTDRRGVQFSVQNICDSCYNIIYNSVPCSLHQSLEQIERTGHFDLRFDFTTETAAEMRDRLSVFAGESDQVRYAYTKGHFHKGVL